MEGDEKLIKSMFKQIDKDNSQALDREEVVSWIRKLEHIHVEKDCKTILEDYDSDNDGHLRYLHSTRSTIRL